MLAELAACNAAFAVIKQCVQNGGEIVNAGKAIAKFVSGKEELQRKVAGKDKSKASSSDLEAFIALEKIRQEEEQLKQLMIYTGRPGLWSDYQKYCAQARRARREEEKERQAKRRKLLFRSAIVGIVATCLLIFSLIVFIVAMAVKSN
tara:strand:- start:1061 stop:1504 length:444 start_codon:yes stop_codon:yes gene_type:complete